MPRTSRRNATTGLAWEALAPVVRWPLHSPRRLAGFLVTVVAIVWLLAAVRPAAVADPTPRQSSSTSPTRPPIATGGPSPTTPPPASPVATSPQIAGVASSPVEVAVRFVTAWARPDLPVETWQTDVIALATSQFGAQLRSVDPRNVPARAVTGPATPSSATEVAATVGVPTDAGPVVVDLALMGSTWQVSGLAPAGPPASRTDGAAASLAATYTPVPVGG